MNSIDQKTLSCTSVRSGKLLSSAVATAVTGILRSTLSRCRDGVFAPISIIVLSLAASSISHAGSNLYRYKNDNGFTVMVEFLPEEAIRNGYQVIDRSGRVIERVAPAETDPKKLEKISAEQQRQLVQAAMQADRDKALRLRYSSVAEVEHTRERALRDLDNRISILRGSRESEIRNIEAQQRIAANRERRGLDIPIEVTDQIKKLRAEVRRLEAEISAMEQRKRDVSEQFDYDVERVKYLLGEN